MSTSTVESHAKESVATHATWLSDLRILCVGSSAVLQIASGVLRDFGARVQYVTAPIDEAMVAAANSDVVLVDRIESAPTINGLAADVREYASFVEGANTSVWVTASAYGLQTNRADAFGSELTTLAAGGILGHSRDGEDGIPTLPAGSIALKLVGITMAMCALHGIHRFRERQSPVHVDLSAQAAIISTGLCLEMAHALAHCANEGGSSRYGAPTGFLECRDGQICIVVLEEHQWGSLRSCLSPRLDDIPTLEDARGRADDVNAAVVSWAATRSAVECERILQRAGVPCTAVNPVQGYLERAREIKRNLCLTSGMATLPAVVAEEQAEDPDEAEGAIPLRSLRVLDAGHVLAVPLATAWLGAMGAQVTKLEDPERLDVYRRRGPFVPGGRGPNRSAYFNQVNYCKQSVDVRVDESGSSLDAAPYQVVVHNLSPRRARSVGVDSATMSASTGARLSIASSGFGASGEWAGYRAYGHNIHAFAGLVAATRDVDGNMADVGTPWADPLAGAVVATWVLAWSLAGRRNRKVAVDLSMAEIMAAQLTDLLGTQPEDYYRTTDDGGDLFVRPEHGGGMVAVTLRNREEVARFEELTGARFTPPASRGGLATQDVLGSLKDLDATKLADRLRTSGFAAAVVHTARDLADDEFIRSTGLFQQVQSTALGCYDVTGLPWVFMGEGRTPLTAAPERP